MATTDKLINGWILLNDDAPHGTNYNDPKSCYQALINNNVYQSTDILFLCFATTTLTNNDTMPAGDGSFYTIRMADGDHAGGYSNEDYFRFIVRDARANNPDIKIGITLEWNNPLVLSNIFANKNYSDQENADQFAANLTAFLKNNHLDGFDVDWESPVCHTITTKQFKLLFTTIRAHFDKVKDRHLYLSLSPAELGNLDAGTINENIDFVNLQLYHNPHLKQEFIAAGIQENLLAYGAKFESISANDHVPYQNAIDVYNAIKSEDYNIITQWRLNSGNFCFEQSQQLKLYRLIKSYEYAEAD